jgi:hypothetical protein
MRRFVLVVACAAVAGAVAIAVAMSACGGGSDDQGPADDPSAELPGTFVPNQGRSHFNYTHDPDIPPRTPFCDGVATSDGPGAPSVDPPAGEFRCYASNPPSSGSHLPIQRNADLGNGARINIPPDPDTYPPDIEIPREAIPHILEHAGVFVGYHCADGDAACEDVVAQVERIVDDRIDNNNDRVVFARDSDLPAGTIGMSSWTRVETFPYAEFSRENVVAFIDTHSCRFDPEGFCR